MDGHAAGEIPEERIAFTPTFGVAEEDHQGHERQHVDPFFVGMETEGLGVYAEGVFPHSDHLDVRPFDLEVLLS